MMKRTVPAPKRRPRLSDKIVFAPQALKSLVAGFDGLASVLALTLGPSNGPIFNSREDGSVEILSDAGMIARRVVEIPGRCQNAGAMILRNLAWRMHEHYGDGAATASVLARAIVRESFKLIEAGIDPVLIRGGLEHGLAVALATLDCLSTPVVGNEQLETIATTLCGEPKLGSVLAEIVDILGPSASVLFEEVPIPYLDRDYVEGAHWRAHPATRQMISEGRTEVALDRPLIFIADQQLRETDDVQAALELAVSHDCRSLLIVAHGASDHVLQTLAVNQSRGVITASFAVLSSVGPTLSDDLEDLAMLTGGTVLGDQIGRAPRRLVLPQLGTARRATLTRDSLVIVDGAGDQKAIAKRKSDLEYRLAEFSLTEQQRSDMQRRLARMNGGTAILKIGALTAVELVERRARAEKALRALAGVVESGVVPGGGTSFVECIDAVNAARRSCSIPGQSVGVEVLARSLSAPFEQIVTNHGRIHPPLAMETLRRLGDGYGFDAKSGNYVNMNSQGILDSARVVKGALRGAVSAASSLITTRVVILPAERTYQAKP